MRARLLATLFAIGCAAPRTAPDSAEPQASALQENRPAASSESEREATVIEPVPQDAKPPRERPKPRALAVPGFGDALILEAEGSGPAPVFVAAHGAGDSPEWQCETWAGPLGGRYFVLCPRGLPLVRGDDSAFYYANHLELEKEVFAALGALKAEFKQRVSAAGSVYSGYSQGATMGALMVIDHGKDFPHLLLMEGGSGEWTASRARRYRETGGKSVAIVCGTSGCAKRAQRSQQILEKAGLRARAEHAEGGGHTYTGKVGERALSLLDGWLLAENP